MTRIKKDFEFIKGIAADFFKKKSIRDTLAMIDEYEISGWEKWLQIELSKTLKEHPTVRRWSREKRYPLDRRASKSRASCSVDFVIHQSKKHSHVALEVKQIDSAKTCIRSMLKDVLKIENIKGSRNDIRSLWCLGIHRHDDSIDVQTWTKSRAIEFDVDIKHMHTCRIGRTEYAYTIF